MAANPIFQIDPIPVAYRPTTTFAQLMAVLMAVRSCTTTNYPGAASSSATTPVNDYGGALTLLTGSALM